jgi:zinc-ribbon domain
MEPEIARRCTDCGAAVRGGSLFCPQCGKALKRHGADAGDKGGGAAAEAATEGPALRATDPGRKASVIVPQGSETETAAGVAPPSPTPAEDAPQTRPSSAEGRRRAEIITRRPEDDQADGRHRRRRVASAAREAVEEKISPRVEKLRHASNVMLEEAAYDPSLRFVLVAAAAVILSLLLLLLNYLLG